MRSDKLGYNEPITVVETKYYIYDDPTYSITESPLSPQDIKKLNNNELNQLSAEIRSFMIKTVSQTGGHLSSNLGVVELSVALHKSFSSPDDKLVWDVGHQIYAHKLLTGRYNEFATLRQEGGISGF